MEALEAILTRRSVRRYTPEPIPDETVRTLLEAAMAAPSAGNEQPWQFVVIRERAVLDEIPKIHPFTQMLKEAPLAILVCGDLTLEKHKGMWVQDCAAATENLLLAVRALGLGGVWCGVYPREDRVEGFRGLLGIPAHVVPFALVALGRPAQEQGPANRYTEARVHVNRW